MEERSVLGASASGLTETGRGAVLDSEFKTEIQANLPASYRLAAVILGDPSEAEDATHDAIEKAWKSRRQLRDPDRFDAWFQRILVNSCRDQERRRRGRPLLLTISPGVSEMVSTEPLEDPYGRSVERDAIGRALGSVDVDQRVVIALRFYLDLEVDEIARRLAIPAGTVKSRLHRGIKALRIAWEATK